MIRSNEKTSIWLAYLDMILVEALSHYQVATWTTHEG